IPSLTKKFLLMKQKKHSKEINTKKNSSTRLNKKEKQSPSTLQEISLTSAEEDTWNHSKTWLWMHGHSTALQEHTGEEMRNEKCSPVSTDLPLRARKSWMPISPNEKKQRNEITERLEKSSDSLPSLNWLVLVYLSSLQKEQNFEISLSKKFTTFKNHLDMN